MGKACLLAALSFVLTCLVLLRLLESDCPNHCNKAMSQSSWASTRSLSFIIGLLDTFCFVELLEPLELQWNLSKVETYMTEVFVRFRQVSALERFELKSYQI